MDRLLSALVVTVLAALAWAIRSGIRMERERTKVWQGLVGERTVATLLAVPRDGRRHQVIHDLPGDEHAKPKGVSGRW